MQSEIFYRAIIGIWRAIVDVKSIKRLAKTVGLQSLILVGEISTIFIFPNNYKWSPEIGKNINNKPVSPFFKFVIFLKNKNSK